MKNLLIITVLLLAGLNGFSQEKEAKIVPIVEPKDSNDIIYVMTESSPEFLNTEGVPDDGKSLVTYLKKRLAEDKEFIKQAKQKGKAIVYVNFIIDQNGDIVNPKILQGLNDELDSLSLKYVREMPKWKPGEHLEKKVKYSYNLPIHFPK